MEARHISTMFAIVIVETLGSLTKPRFPADTQSILIDRCHNDNTEYAAISKGLASRVTLLNLLGMEIGMKDCLSTKKQQLDKTAPSLCMDGEQDVPSAEDERCLG